jgi:exopolysaccharide biosynthesis polyprenyl glycosylphosphotransferase
MLVPALRKAGFHGYYLRRMAAPERSYAAEGRLLRLKRGSSAPLSGTTNHQEMRRFSQKNAGVLRQEWVTAFLYLFLDVAVWIGLYGAISYLRQDTFYTSRLEFILIDFIQLAVIVQALYIVGGYDRNVDKRTLIYAVEHILAIMMAAGVSALVIYSAATFDALMKPSRGALLLSFVLFLPISLLYRRWIGWHVAATVANRVFLVVGSGANAVRFYEAYKNSPKQQQLHFVDLFGERVGEPIAGDGSPIIEGDLAGKLRNLSHQYSGIILAEPVKKVSLELLDGLVRTQFHRTRVYTLESFYETHWRYVPLDVVDPVWPLQTGFQLARISPYHYLKRLFDMFFALVALCFVWPLLVAISLLIWIVDGWPILYSQSRVGRESEPFVVHKFRTMMVRPEENAEDIYTRSGDPRVTRLGRWLRRLRLDELPQLWNVLIGDMSIIGPRAEWVKCAERYEKAIPFYHFRHLVKPGITGWAQVNYPYGESDEDAIEKLKYDLYYIRNYSLKLDAMIVLKTVHTMLFGKGR